MAEYITGYSKPRFLIINSSGLIIDTIDLNLCGTDGLTENYEFYLAKHNLLNYSEVTYFYGYHINFNLSYSEYSNKTNSLAISKLINHILNNYKLIIVPRIDILNRYYNVNYTGDSITLNILNNGANSIGNKSIELNFRTSELQTQMKWLNPDDLTITIDDFVVAA